MLAPYEFQCETGFSCRSGMTTSTGSALMKRLKTETSSPRVLALQESVAKLEKEKLERELEVLEIQKEYYAMKLAREERTQWIQTQGSAAQDGSVMELHQVSGVTRVGGGDFRLV